MSEYPRVHALLTELGELDETERQLPLALLLNMHRALLRLPLERVSALGHGTDMGRALAILDARWPVLAGGQIFRQRASLGKLRDTIVSSPSWFMQRVQVWTKIETQGLTHTLLSATGYTHAWDASTPAVLLYELTLGEVVRDDALRVLEITLGLHPMVGLALCELAAMTPEAAGQLDVAEATRLARTAGKTARHQLIRDWRQSLRL